MKRQQKTENIERMHAQFGKAVAAIVTDFQGMDVESVTKLRRSMREANVEYFVAKNTLTMRAVENTVFEPLKEKLTGVNSIGLAYEDPIALAKAINNYAKEDDKLKIKFGFLAKSEQFIDEKQITVLADIPPREVLLARLAGALKSQHSKFATVLSEIMGKFVRTMGAVQAKKEDNN